MSIDSCPKHAFFTRAPKTWVSLESIKTPPLHESPLKAWELVHVPSTHYLRKRSFNTQGHHAKGSHEVNPWRDSTRTIHKTFTLCHSMRVNRKRNTQRDPTKSRISNCFGCGRTMEQRNGLNCEQMNEWWLSTERHLSQHREGVPDQCLMSSLRLSSLLIFQVRSSHSPCQIMKKP